MSSRSRNKSSGKFTQKSDEPRKVRSIRLTDSTWEKLGEMADKKSTAEQRITRADLIEEWLQKDHVIHGQLELFEVKEDRPQTIKEPLAEIDWSTLGKKLQKKFVSVMSSESKLGESAKAFKAAKKSFREVLKVLQEELG